jgi:tetratricopeptide (TPR) repeat protein
MTLHRDISRLFREKALIEIGASTGEALMSKSTALLNDEQRSCFAMLGVFPPSPATFDAAALRDIWLLDNPVPMMKELEKKGLVEVDREKRLWIHSALAAYAANLLDGTTTKEVRLRQSRHYLEVLARCERSFTSGDSASRLGAATFDKEWPNIVVGQRSAADYGAHDETAADLCIRYALAAIDLGRARRSPQLNLIWQRDAEGHATRLGRQLDLLVIRINAGNCQTDLGHYQDAVKYFRMVVEEARGLTKRRIEGMALDGLGIAYRRMGACQAAARYSQSALRIFRSLGDRRSEARALDNLGLARRDMGDWKPAIKHLGRALTIVRDLKDDRNEANILNHLGTAHRQSGDLLLAGEEHTYALKIARHAKDPSGEGYAMLSLGIVNDLLRRATEAVACHEHAISIFRSLADRRGEAYGLLNLGAVYSALGDPPRASEYTEQAFSILRDIGDWRGIGEALHNAASIQSASKAADS